MDRREFLACALASPFMLGGRAMAQAPISQATCISIRSSLEASRSPPRRRSLATTGRRGGEFAS